MLLTGGGSGLTVWAQQRVPSGITALLISSVPLLVLLLNWAFFARRAPEPRALVGALVGLKRCGAHRRSPADAAGHVRPPYVIALLCAMLCWSVGTLVASGAVPAARVGAATCVQMAAGGHGAGVPGIAERGLERISSRAGVPRVLAGAGLPDVLRQHRRAELPLCGC